MGEESLEVADFTAHVRWGCVSGGTLYSPEERPPPLGWTRVNNDKTRRLPHPPQVRICAQKPNRFISHSSRQLGDLCVAIPPAWHSIGGGGGRGGGGVGADTPLPPFFFCWCTTRARGKKEVVNLSLIVSLTRWPRPLWALGERRISCNNRRYIEELINWRAPPPRPLSDTAPSAWWQVLRCVAQNYQSARTQLRHTCSVFHSFFFFLEKKSGG